MWRSRGLCGGVPKCGQRFISAVATISPPVFETPSQISRPTEFSSEFPYSDLYLANATTMADDEQLSIYDEIEIEDMTYDPNLQIYHYPCPCGDRFEIPIDSLRDGEEIAVCPSCSLMIRVIFDPVSFFLSFSCTTFCCSADVFVEGFGEGGNEGSPCAGRSQSVNKIGQNSVLQEMDVGRRLQVKQYRLLSDFYSADRRLQRRIHQEHQACSELL
jgi:diphthamide biosynthesis protein 3